MKRNLLIVCQKPFFLGWGGGTSRTFDIVEGLNEFEWRTTLLAGPVPRCHEEAIREPEQQFPGEVVRTDFCSCEWPRWTRRRVVWRIGALWDRIKGHRWASRVPRWYTSSRSLPTPDVIWAISFGQLHSPVAAHNLAKHLHCPWVAEFRDPCPPPGQSMGSFDARVIRRSLANASAVVTTTQALADDLVTRYPSYCAQKTMAIHHCFSGAYSNAQNHTAGDNSLLLLHVGHLYGGRGRNALALVRALATLSAKNPTVAAAIHLNLLGSGPGITEAMDLAKNLEIPNMLSADPAISLPEALNRMDAADVLVLIKFPSSTYNLQIPGKTFQYLGKGKPILGIMGECEAADIIRQSGLGIVVGHDDITGMAEALAKLWHNKSKLSEIYRPNREYISQFSRSSMAKRVNELLMAVMDEDES